MNDTKVLIKYVRDRIKDGPNITFGKPTVRDLVDALEQAEAENTRLTKMVDWLAEFVFDRPCAYACCPFDKHRPTGPDDDDCDKTHIQCWAEAARRAVADSEVKA